MRSGKLCHPTASEVYDAVRRYIPSVSLGTVYRNLNALSLDGEIARIDTGNDKSARFDANVCAHTHFTCKRCGAIYDTPIDKTTQRMLFNLMGDGFMIDSLNISFSGVCPKCTKEQRQFNQKGKKSCNR